MRSVKSEMERFDSKINRTETCWAWTASRDPHGYGRFGIRTDQGWRTALAHRFAYEAWVGPIPAGMVLDHLCRNTSCVRPDHLEVVTQKENVLRGESVAARTIRSGKCQRGHDYATERTPGPGGTCRACARDRYAAARQHERTYA